MKMPQIQPRVAKALVLALATVVSLGALLPDGASAARRRSGVTTKNCSLGGHIYALNACKSGFRCVRDRFVDGEYIWEIDEDCPKTSGGQTQGGFGQV